MAQSEQEFEREQEDAAAAEAGAIGGQVSSEPPREDDEERDPAQQPLVEAGQGESEGFEQAERELEEHASHGNEHAARRVLEDAASFADEGDGRR
jgi:cell division protein FtsN